MYGYARVSSREQNLSRQLDALIAFGVTREMVFTDKASGRNFDRPEWKRLAEGIAAAHARGIHLGRPKKKRPAC